MDLMNFKLVTPERQVLNKEIVSLSCPTTLGQITILPGHAELVATLIPGELHAKTGESEFFINVTGGFVEVKKDSQVIVLADAAEHHYEIDEKRAEEAVERAKTEMQKVKASDLGYARVAAAFERNLTRVKIARKHAHRKAPITGEGIFKE